MRYFILLISLMFIFSMPTVLSCGGGGGGDDDDDSVEPSSCAPAAADRTDPTYDLNTAGDLGQWTLTLTRTDSSCDSPPTSITCVLDMVVTGNDVAISGTCTSVAAISVTVTIDDLSGIVSGASLYWGGTLTGTSGTYTETDSVLCTEATFVSNILSNTFTVEVNVEWEDDDESDSCSTTFSGIFT